MGPVELLSPVSEANLYSLYRVKRLWRKKDGLGKFF